MKRLNEWLWRYTADREALEGDFVEAGLSEGARMAALLGLLARRHGAAWTRPRPWIALLALLPGYLLASVAIAVAAQILTPYREPVYTGDDAAVWAARTELVTRYGIFPCLLAALYAWMVGICNRKLVGEAAGMTRWLLPMAGALALPYLNQAVYDPAKRAAVYAAQGLLVLAAHEWGFRWAEREVSLGGRVLALVAFWGAALLVAGPVEFSPAFWQNGVAGATLALSWPFYFWIADAKQGEGRVS